MAVMVEDRAADEKTPAINPRVTDVWAHNFLPELCKIADLRKNRPYIFIDTEFPGFLQSSPRGAAEEDCYTAVKFNVDKLKLVQLGITLSDGQNLEDGCSWQFNMKDFDPEVDACDLNSIEFLKNHGIDFEKNRAEGVSAEQLKTLMCVLECAVWGQCKWITFHGIYDVAYLIKLLDPEPLPDTLSGFLSRVWDLLGWVYDVKYLAGMCGRYYADRGLMQLSWMLGIRWAGKLHQGGHDSLLTALVFFELKKSAGLISEQCHEGILYGAVYHGRVEAQKYYYEQATRMYNSVYWIPPGYKYCYDEAGSGAELIPESTPA